jgi:hypothetical protein
VKAPSFDRLFRQLARRVRFRRTMRDVLSGSTFGAALAAILSLAAFELGFGELRWYAAVALFLGAALGWAHGRRRRWSDAEVALYLDARLGAEESFTTGVLLQQRAPGAAEVAQQRAVEQSAAADSRQVRPRLWLRWHGLLPLSLVAFIWLALRPLPPEPIATKTERGTERVQKSAVPGLERIEALAQTQALSAADAERLAALAREAKRLGDDLKRGLERREAQARIGQLRDELAGERQRPGAGAERAGLEAALRALEAERSMLRAQRALAEGDVVGFDDEMRRLANQAESDARRAAREALSEAARAARERGAKQLAELLERQKQSFAEREALNRALTELGEQLLDEQTRGELGEHLRKGDPESAERLAEALARAFAQLSEEERKRLLESLKRKLTQDPALATGDPERLQALLERLNTPEGQRALLDALRSQVRGKDAEREHALRDAERGAAEAEQSLGAVPMPLASGKSSADGPNGPGQSPAPFAKPGQSGPGRGPGAGQHDGQTPAIDAPELRAKASTRVLPGVPLGAKGFGRAPGISGEIASQVGSGEVGRARSDAIGAIEGSDVPEDYREHVGRYFEP